MADDDPTQSLEVVVLYPQLGNLAKAKLCLSRARIRLLKLPASNQTGSLSEHIEALRLKTPR
jgi:hypothetical protein